MSPAAFNDIRPVGADEWQVLWPCIHELRPHIERHAVAAVLAAQAAEGYRMLGLFAGDGDTAVAWAGYRILTTLQTGRHLYLDDLVALPETRGRGAGRALLAELRAIAEQEGCRAMALDSGVGPARAAAHRLYLADGFEIAAMHFVRRMG